MKEQRTGYYVSHKNPLLWLSIALILSSAAVRMICYAGQEVSRSFWWLQILLPTLTCVIFALVLLCSCKARFHKSFYTVALSCIFFAIFLTSRNGVLLSILAWFACLAVAAVYFLTVTGTLPTRWLLPFLFGLPLCARLVWLLAMLHAMPQLSEASALLLLGGIFVIVLAMRRHPNDGKWRPGWGDRVDGRRLRSLEAMAQASPLFMVTRNSASNYFADSIEITNVERYIHEKRKQGMKNFGLLHVLLAAYVRTVSQYPALNRFLAGQKIYHRDELEISMTVKKEMSTDSPDSMIDVFFHETDTAEDVYHAVNEAIQNIKNTPMGNSFDNTALAFSLVPTTLCKFLLWLIRTADYFGMLPLWLVHISPFHGSMFITSMGSLGIPPIYHHLYDFGNLPVFISFGKKRRENEVLLDGTIVPRKYLDFTVVTDERICDGFYYAAAFKYLRRLLAHPERLDTPPERVVEDIR